MHKKQDLVVDTLIEALRGYDPKVREAAALCLGEIGDERAFDLLFDCCCNEEWRHSLTSPSAYLFIADAAGKIATPSKVPRLIKALHDNDGDIRVAAARALGNMGPPIPPALATLFSDHDPSVRKQAVKAAVEIGDPEAVDLLIGVLKSSEERHAIVTAIEALGYIGNGKAAVDIIETICKDPNYYLFNTKVRENILMLGVPLTDALIDSLINAKDNDCCRLIIEILGDIKDPATIDYLLPFLEAKEDSLRIAAIKALGSIGDSRVVTRLAKLLREENASIVKEAAKALGNIGDPSAVKTLSDVLENISSENWTVRPTLLEALGMIEHPSGIEAVVEAWHCAREAGLDFYTDSNFIKVVIGILEHRKHKEAESILFDILLNFPQNNSEIEEIAETLNKDEEKLLSSLDPEEQASVLSFESSSDFEDELWRLKDEIRWRTLRALDKNSPIKRPEELLDFLLHSETNCLESEYAIRILAKSADKEAIVTLAILASAENHELSGNEFAFEQLERIRHKMVAGPLMAVLASQDQEAKAAAINYFGRIRYSKAVKPILALLGKENNMHLYDQIELAICRIGIASLPGIIHTLRHGNSLIRQETARIAYKLIQDLTQNVKYAPQKIKHGLCSS